MDPVAGERRAFMGAAALGDLVLVVGEDEVEAAAVDVDRLARDARSIIAEHSICQPGRPRPQGLSQPITPSGDGFQSTKSAGSFL